MSDCPFKVGDVVVCVDNEPYHEDQTDISRRFKLGNTYTVRTIAGAVHRKGKFFGSPCIGPHETDGLYSADRFVSAQEQRDLVDRAEALTEAFKLVSMRWGQDAKPPSWL